MNDEDFCFLTYIKKVTYQQGWHGWYHHVSGLCPDGVDGQHPCRRAGAGYLSQIASAMTDDGRKFKLLLVKEDSSKRGSFKVGTGLNIRWTFYMVDSKFPRNTSKHNWPCAEEPFFKSDDRCERGWSVSMDSQETDDPDQAGIREWEFYKSPLSEISRKPGIAGKTWSVEALQMGID